MPSTAWSIWKYVPGYSHPPKNPLRKIDEDQHALLGHKGPQNWDRKHQLSHLVCAPWESYAWPDASRLPLLPRRQHKKAGLLWSHTDAVLSPTRPPTAEFPQASQLALWTVA